MLGNSLIVESIMASINEGMELDREKEFFEVLTIVSEFARGASGDIKEETLNKCKKEFENLKMWAEAGVSNEC